MSFIISKIGNLMEKCSEIEDILSNIPRWRPKAKYVIAEASATCIAKVMEGYLKGIYMVDLSGGEFASDFTGRDVDLIVEIESGLAGLESELKLALEYALNSMLFRYAASYISEVGKKDVVEIHVVSDYRRGYGWLIRSRHSPAIRLWPPQQETP